MHELCGRTGRVSPDPVLFSLWALIPNPQHLELILLRLDSMDILVSQDPRILNLERILKI